jgi:hypothetical protein
MAKSNPTARRGYAITKGTGRTADDHVESLVLDDDTAPARAGERLSSAERRKEIPAKRVRTAGMTGADFPSPRTSEENVTDDDLAPETLLHERRDADELPNDQVMKIVEIDEIGAGAGLDEAELALREHPDTNTSTTRRK